MDCKFCVTIGQPLFFEVLWYEYGKIKGLHAKNPITRGDGKVRNS